MEDEFKFISILRIKFNFMKLNFVWKKFGEIGGFVVIVLVMRRRYLNGTKSGFV